MSEAKTEEVGLVYATHLDPMRDLPRTSLYLDEESRRASEITRARLEDRDPDLENPPSNQGTPLFEQRKLRAEVPRGVNLDPDVVAETHVVTEEAAKQDEADTELGYDPEQGAKDHPEETQGANREPDAEEEGEGADPTNLPGDEVNSFDLTGTNASSTTS